MANRNLRSKTVLLGGLGTLVLIVTIVAVFRANLLLTLPSVRGLVDEAADADLTRVVVWSATVLVLYAIWAGRSTTIRETKSARRHDDVTEQDVFAESRQKPPEAVTASRRSITAEKLDSKIHRAKHGDAPAMDAVRTELERIAVAAVMHRDGLEEAAARSAVERGTWTDAHLPAAFLGSDTATSFRLLERLRLWLDPVAERDRRIEATVEAIRDTFRWGTAE